MSKKHENNDIPDFSAVFNVDNDSLPKELIEKDPAASTKNLGFLSGNNEDTLTEKEKKERAKQQKAENKKKRVNSFKNRMLIVLIAVVLVFVAGTGISIAVKESQKPVITAEKPVVQTISRYTENTGVTISAGNTFKVVFIDNDYDVHYIEMGQTVELYDENGTLHKGKITDIREASPDSYYIKEYSPVLIGDVPSTSVYAVFVTLDNPSLFDKEGISLKVKVLTKTAIDALTISSSAVYIDGNQHYVWVYTPFKKTLTRQDVKVGLSVDGITEITGGLDKSHKVAVSISCPEEKIYDGIKVKTD